MQRDSYAVPNDSRISSIAEGQYLSKSKLARSDVQLTQVAPGTPEISKSKGSRTRLMKKIASSKFVPLIIARPISVKCLGE